MTDMSTAGQGRQVFVSYAHVDNELMNQAVRQFTEDLKSFYAAKSGDYLKVFFDRDSIDWGDDWRKNIEANLRAASIFMPIITMQYFNRPACREELNAFHDSASLLDAGYLILPVVILGASSITAESEMPEVRLIESIQFQNLETAFLAGPGTREWRESINDITDKLIRIFEKADQRLATSDQDDLSSPSVSDQKEGEDEDEEETDLLQSMTDLEVVGHRVEGELQKASEDLTTWVNVLGKALDQFTPGKSPAVMRAESVKMARVLTKPSKDLQESATQVAQTTSEADALLRSMFDQLSGAGTSQADDLLRELAGSISSEADDIQEVMATSAEMLDVLKTLELLSVPLRKAIKPGRVGLTKIHDALRIIDSWNRLTDR